MVCLFFHKYTEIGRLAFSTKRVYVETIVTKYLGSNHVKGRNAHFSSRNQETGNWALRNFSREIGDREIGKKLTYKIIIFHANFT